MHETMTFATTPAATAANSEYLPWDTAKPANSIVASLGIGMQADSGIIRAKIPAIPRSPTTFVAKSTSRSVTEASTSMGQARVALRAGPAVRNFLRPVHGPDHRADRRRGAFRPLHPRPRGGGVRARVRGL